MIVSPRERMLQAITHQQVDHIPTQINFTHAMGEKLAAYFGLGLSELPARLGNHLRRLDLTYPKRASPDGGASFDWWGVGWSTATEGYWPAVSPLSDCTDLDKFYWPDPRATGLLHGAAEVLAAEANAAALERHFIVPNLGFALFERAWSLRGFEKLMEDLALRSDFVADLLDRITAIQEVLAQRFITLGVDGGYFGDDYGAQQSLLFSPRTWRALFKPRLARLFAVFREAGLPVILHSDGDITEILPDLVEIGLTVLNPVQPEVLNLHWLKSTFAGQLAFYGGISTQTVLPHGTPAEVRSAARAALRVLAADGTGLVLAPSHRMTTDIPIENVAALLDVFEEMEGKAHAG